MINKIVTKLKKLNPISIFIYGSQATQTINSKSDFEIGILFDNENYVTRNEIAKLINNNKFSVFPFKIDDLKNYTLDTPFQKKIYINSLINGNSKTIYGEKIIENLTPPQISNIDLLMDCSFNLGYATSAIRANKSGNINLANDLFYKSLFYATRNLIYLKTKKLISGYNNIYNYSKTLELPNKYLELLKLAYKLRNEEITEINSAFYFRNVSFINQFVIPSIEKEIKKNSFENIL